MPWFRLDENAMDHPKFLALSDGAWRLWCEGQSYCQKHLTDGVIVLAALKGFRYYSPSRVKNLTDILVPDKGPCWHLRDHGIEVHDFLDWNASKADVLKGRQETKDRKLRWREHRASENASWNASKDAAVLRDVTCGDVERSFGSSSSVEKSSSSPRKDLRVCDSATEEIAGGLMERYGEVYARCRSGAAYHTTRLNMDRDLDNARALAKGWPSLPRLLEMLEVFLLAKIGEKNMPGTPGQFLHMAPEMDSLLRKNGR